ncbi:MAG: hypothetical protein M1812_002617 [Candelaria pacifica]|nr:MAG: hypothetical protein M1812_002617 [Candelaria pacifica]
MSSDLLAEFDSLYQAPSEASHAGFPESGTQSHSLFDDLSSLDPARSEGQLASKDSAVDQDAEDWGAFESFGDLGTSPIPPKRQEQSISEQRILWDDLAAFESTVQPLAGQYEHSPSKRHLVSQKIHQSRHSICDAGYNAEVDVLFDAEAPGLGDDEFGDFESVDQEPLTQPSQTPDRGLWPTPARTHAASKGLEELQPMPHTERSGSPRLQEINPFAELSVGTEPPEDPRRHHETGTPITAWPSFVPLKIEPVQQDADPEATFDNDWGDFTDSPALPIAALEPSNNTTERKWEFSPPHTTNMPLKLPQNPTIAQLKPAPAPIQSPDTTTGSIDFTIAAPPTNIPPPSILLRLFSPLFNLSQSALFTPLSTQPTPLKDRILSDPSTLTFLRGYLFLATVCARLIAGRKLRWKRDNHLSQSMKIGSAQSSKLSGMKLTGIDKAENSREEREVADVVRIWKEQLGKLRSAVAAANASGASSPLGLIPDIAEVLHVRVGKVGDGAVVAEKACVLCGLKREERVEKVDVNVEDTFGEWWVEYWGHTACRNFWNEHKDELSQR